jgi:hypothetical protein
VPALADMTSERPDPRAAGGDANLTNWLEMEVLRAEAEAALAPPPGGP